MKTKFTNEFFALHWKATDSWHYGAYPILLTFLFNEFEDPKGFRTKDTALNDDIKSVIEIFNRLNERKRKSKGNQYYKGFIQQDIEKLNKIMKKVPIYVGVDFVDYEGIDFNAAEAKQYGKDSFNRSKLNQQMRGIVKKIRAKNVLSEFSLRPFPVDADFYERLDARGCRYLLTLGIFDFLQGVISGKGVRLKKCGRCSQWFVYERSSKKFCAPLCRSRTWNNDNKEACRIKSKKCREQ